MDKQPAPHSVSSIARNIGIGVVTPVLAATIIYFLGFNKGDNTEFKKKKEATISTWAVFVQNKAIFSSVFDQMNKSGDIEKTRASTNHEIDVTLLNMENLKKEANADQRVYSTIDITIQQMKELKPMFNKFFDDILTYAATNPTEEEGQIFIQKLGSDFKKEVDELKNRDSIRLNTFYEGLNKDYNIKLPKN